MAPYFGLMHCMIFPSFMEGLPVAMLESQAAGVPIIASDRISSGIAAIPEMVDYLPLEAGVQKWADAVERRLAESRRDPHKTAATWPEASLPWIDQLISYVRYTSSCTPSTVERWSAIRLLEFPRVFGSRP